MTNGDGSIPIDTFLVGWTSIYQLFWGSLGTGFDPSPNEGHWFVSCFTLFWSPRGDNSCHFVSCNTLLPLEKWQKWCIGAGVEEHWSGILHHSISLWKNIYSIIEYIYIFFGSMNCDMTIYIYIYLLWVMTDCHFISWKCTVYIYI